MNKTTIEWTDFTWNPVTGCNKVSQGCKHCYAETIANRFWGERKFTDVQTHPERLSEPARPMHPAWVRSLRNQCAAANVPFFFKQWGEYLPINHCDEDMYWKSVKSVEVGYGVSTETMFKVGKSKSGNVLDGKQHLEFPIENRPSKN